MVQGFGNGQKSPYFTRVTEPVPVDEVTIRTFPPDPKVLRRLLDFVWSPIVFPLPSCRLLFFVLRLRSLDLRKTLIVTYGDTVELSLLKRKQDSVQW